MKWSLFRQDLQPGEHARTFRASVPIRVGAYYVLFGAAAVFPYLGIFHIEVLPVLVATMAETAALAALYRWAVRSQKAAYGL
jgi:hypothetical protein